jgi:hypothetical protein
METREAKLLHRILSTVSRGDVLDILDSMDKHSYASMHLGISAQCAAIDETTKACDAAIDNVREYYQGELIKHVDDIVRV